MRSRRIRVIALPALLVVVALATACRQAGNETTTVVVDGLRYTAEVKLVDVAPTLLHAAVTLTNVTDETINVEYGGCAFVHLLGFDSPARSGAPVWDSAERRDPVTGAVHACDDYLVQGEVAPGESLSPKELQLFVPSYEILGHSLLGRFLPDGRYYWLAQVQVNNRSVEVPAGQVSLKMNEPPLPRKRMADGLVYQVETRTLTSPLGIVATLTIANNSDNRVSTYIARYCPFSLYVYKEKARRDAAYVAGEPDGTQQGSCRLEMDAFGVAAGGSRQLTITVPAAEVLGDSLGEGRYYLAAAVWLRERVLLLAAGDVELQR